jgi:hypothetical protein
MKISILLVEFVSLSDNGCLEFFLTSLDIMIYDNCSFIAKTKIVFLFAILNSQDLVIHVTCAFISKKEGEKKQSLSYDI